MPERFTIELRAAPSRPGEPDAYARLKLILKRLLRSGGFTCTDCRETQPKPVETTKA